MLRKYSVTHKLYPWSSSVHLPLWSILSTITVLLWCGGKLTVYGWCTKVNLFITNCGAKKKRRILYDSKVEDD
ncbi:hypothetical protein MA16_Dca008545 [Dendrobium catenatum]|uniref:Uncharacterized protein n=1 Tax=Dendrobium catenatum TaxID=906689 RepID=A0A2I0XHR9_9ASPA|nr:hypothetical protein MA16_Dca008545 [Dendrobium catenatum]